MRESGAGLGSFTMLPVTKHDNLSPILSPLTILLTYLECLFVTIPHLKPFFSSNTSKSLIPWTSLVSTKQFLEYSSKKSDLIIEESIDLPFTSDAYFIIPTAPLEI